MRALEIHTRYRIPAGEDVSTRAEVAVLREAGHDVDYWELDNARVNPLRAALNTAWNNEAVRDELNRRIDKFHPHVIHIHNTHFAAGPALIDAAVQSGVAVALSVHNYRLICPGAFLWRDGQQCTECVGKAFAWPGVRHGCYRNPVATLPLAIGNALYRWDKTFDQVDAIAPVSEFVGQMLVKGGFDARKIRAKPNCVHPDPGWSERANGYFVLAGRLVAEKGIKTLIRAWELLGEKAPPLRIIGQGPMYGWGEDLPGVTYLGPQSHDMVMAHIKRARAVVVPSEGPEPFGRVPVEAAACGTPAIVSGAGGLPEALRVRSAPWLFAPGDAEDLAACVDEVVSMPLADMRIVREQQRQHWRQHYSAEAQLTHLLGLYDFAVRNCVARYGAYALPPQATRRTMA